MSLSANRDVEREEAKSAMLNITTLQIEALSRWRAIETGSAFSPRVRWRAIQVKDDLPAL
jgi:hypothetical protein